MDHSRLRIRNLGRLAGAGAGVLALALVLPGLFARPEPPPLPDDVGLGREPASTPVTSPQSAATTRAGARLHPQVAGRREADRRRRKAPRPARNAARERVRRPPKRVVERALAGEGPPAPAVFPTGTAPAPVAGPATGPTAAPALAAPEAGRSQAGPGGAGGTRGPSEFGFER